MKLLRLAAVLFLASMLTHPLGCGGGGGDGGGGSPPLATGTFTKTVNITSNGENWAPFKDTPDNETLQQLYYASEVQGAGYLTGISFRRSSTMVYDVFCNDMTVKLGHTNITAVSNTFENNVETGQGTLVTVINNETIMIPAGPGGEYFDIPLTKPFYYNGVDNLIVEFRRAAACSGIAGVDRNSAMATDRQANTYLGNVVTGPILRLTKFHFSGGDDIATMPSGTPGQHAYPFISGTQTAGRKAQFLYTPAEIDGEGPITGIGFMLNVASTGATYSYTVRIGHATISDFVGNTTFDNNFSDTPVIVANNASLVLPAGVPAGEYFWLPLHGAFTYNGVDNLIVEVETTASTASTYIRALSGTGTNAKLHGSLGAATGEPIDMKTPMKFRFNGGTVDKIVGTGGFDTNHWFTDVPEGTVDQYLYLASELGTGGAITRVACRLDDDNIIGPTTATDYTNFDMVMSHTTATSLGTDFAANLPSPVTVHSGTFSLPAGLIAGDWVEVPLQTAFSYDPAKNLVIQVRSDSGSNAYGCSLLSDATQFPARRAMTSDRTAATGAVFQHLKDIRLWISN